MTFSISVTGHGPPSTSAAAPQSTVESSAFEAAVKTIEGAVATLRNHGCNVSGTANGPGSKGWISKTL